MFIIGFHFFLCEHPLRLKAEMCEITKVRLFKTHATFTKQWKYILIRRTVTFAKNLEL